MNAACAHMMNIIFINVYTVYAKPVQQLQKIQTQKNMNFVLVLYKEGVLDVLKTYLKFLKQTRGGRGEKL